MTAERRIDRREFTLAAAMAILSGVAITVSGCSGSSGSPTAPSPTASTTGATDKTGSISSNHGHVATITSAQLTAAAGITLGIQGTAGHPHTVTLSSSDIASIAASQRVAKESTTDSGHSHTVTFN